MRPSTKPLHEQPEDFENLYNVDNMIHTSFGTKFDSKIRIQIVVREDGTTIPSFIYRTGNVEAQVESYSETGKPFVIDMTDENRVLETSRYIGFDFGTSNTSLCFISNTDIQEIEVRNSDASWLELKDLVPKLPYPVSFPIRKYLSITNMDASVDNARDAFESMLCFAAYTAACELISIGGMKPTIMKSFQHRSMGPLKALLLSCLERLGKNAEFSKPFKIIFEKYSKEIDDAIDEFNEHKHKKRNAALVRSHIHLRLLANVFHKFIENKVFGYFVFVQPAKFKKKECKGIFKVAHDNQPFFESYQYCGSELFELSEPLIVDLNSNKALSLLPFYFMEEDAESRNSMRCYVFDNIVNKRLSFKAVDEEIVKEINEEYEELNSLIEAAFSGELSERNIYVLANFNITEDNMC